MTYSKATKEIKRQIKVGKYSNRQEGVNRVTRIVKERHSHRRHSKIGFLALKEIELGTIFGTASRQLKKSNHRKGVPK